MAALPGHAHADQISKVTGPRLLTFKDAGTEISASLGHPVSDVDMLPDAYPAALCAAGAPEDVVMLPGVLVTEVLDGRNAFVAGGMPRALGRPPRDFADLLARAIEDGHGAQPRRCWHDVH